MTEGNQVPRPPDTFDAVCNPRSAHAAFALRHDRRTLLKGGASAVLLTLFGGWRMPAAAASVPVLLGFQGIPPRQEADFDQVAAPPGYRARPFFAWGDPVLPGAPAWRPDASDDWQAQLQQAGDNHDGQHFFPFATAPGTHGLLVVNHEYVNASLHPRGRELENGRRRRDDVKKEQAAHGVSVLDIRRDARGQWQPVADSRYNRRISAFTPMRIAGPLAGHDSMKTASDPEGRTVQGTLGNCAMGVTPWGTYLTCEENWHIYFHNRDAADHARRLSHWRYGLPAGAGGSTYQWETVDSRFDATPAPELPHGGQVQEPHRFGWVVEIDPFDPASTPVKRTALGRLFREGATVVLGQEGRLAVYSGDDAKGEYLYKFVADGRFQPGNAAHNRDLLDAGTLYVACFHPDGRGEWKALRLDENGLTAAAGFESQASILLNARAAADRVGATPLDRPEWIAVHPRTREMYLSCTNNDARGEDDPVDAANPRPHNLHGHILRWREAGQDPAALAFSWDLFVLAGEPAAAVSAPGATPTGTIRTDTFSSPDGLAFDGAGRLWIATDYDDQAAHVRHLGCNQLLCADPASGEIRRFLVGPRGCEITGMAWAPDYRTLWVNVQHPGLHFPASDGKSRPRSCTVEITRTDGGVIGS